MPATCPVGAGAETRSGCRAQDAVAGMARSYIKLHGRGNGDPCIASQCATSAALSRTPRDP